ncbi:hypothetical protein IAQ61_007568 [Plenodomus lingam]|uniref:uncharacterized protein n=1 Tax=Leptosphaeria maculans TaxID=5022 RepID=UPI003320799C|nr:hypothetical protein IAQ61_007568 [Plenodomus lingam]
MPGPVQLGQILNIGWRSGPSEESGYKSLPVERDQEASRTRACQRRQKNTGTMAAEYQRNGSLHR